MNAKNIAVLTLFIFVSYKFGVYIGTSVETYKEKEPIKTDYSDTLNIKSIEAQVSKLSANDIKEYLELKTLKEKYLKADEILGKVMLIFLANLSLKFPEDQTKWARYDLKERESNINTFKRPIKEIDENKVDKPSSKKTELKNEDSENRYDDFSKKVSGVSLDQKWSLRGGKFDKQRRSQFRWPEKPLSKASIPIRNFNQIRKKFSGSYEGVFLSDGQERTMIYSLKKNNEVNKAKNVGTISLEVYSKSKRPYYLLSETQSIYYATEVFDYGNLPGHLPLVFEFGENIIVNIFKYRDRLDIYGQIFKKNKASTSEIGRFILIKSRVQKD